MQEYMKDTDFVPIHVERETYDCPPPKPQPRPRLFAELSSLSLAGLAQMLLKVSRTKRGQRSFAKVRDLTDFLLLQVYADSEGEQILSCVDSGRILADFHERARLREVGICFSNENFIKME